MAALRGAISAAMVVCGYESLHLAALAWKASSPFPLLLMAVFVFSIWSLSFCLKHLNMEKSLPSFIASQIAIALFTVLCKFVPVVDVGQSAAFILESILLSLIFWRMIISDPGKVETISSFEMSNNFNKKKETSIDYMNGNSIKDSLSMGVNEANHCNSQDVEALLFENKKVTRGRHCKHCQLFVERYDHHCNAIENCIGAKNLRLFILLLVSFILAEALYVSCYISYINKLAYHTDLKAIKGGFSEGFQSSLLVAVHALKSHGNRNTMSAYNASSLKAVFIEEPWVSAVACFAGMQILWQVPFLLFHLYCIAVNLTTDEWVNWENNPSFYVEIRFCPGQSFMRKRFINPYDSGIKQNITAFFHGMI